MKNFTAILLLTLTILSGCNQPATTVKESSPDYAIHGIQFNEVSLQDKFWANKIETNRTITIPSSFEKCEEMGRMDNFLIAGGKMEGPVKGEMPFDDTDVYKIIEGASYSMTTTPDESLDQYVDSVIALIKIGQEPDGYLTTYKTIDTTHAPAFWCPAGARWENLTCSHELYNSGHMFEAAAAHYHATGKRNFLDIALKNADLLVDVFNNKLPYQVPGHQIVETGLIKLYLITNKKPYLDLAKHFLDMRGDSIHRENGGAYTQDDKPVIEQKEAVGHAVRATYMYAGMTDVAALFDDKAYQEAVDSIWTNIVTKKLYITGGIGARHDGEAFGENYELPNLTAYNETCSAIANVYWNYRMFLLHGQSKYIDVLERSLYNGVISGVGLDGKTFFYPNPLACDMEYHFNKGSLTREPWFDCSCCPSNLCRFMPSVPSYIYAKTDDKVYVNLFIQSETKIKVAGTDLDLRQKTEYPWKGDVEIKVSPSMDKEFTLCVRIPGWAQNQPVPSDLYTYENANAKSVSLTINGKPLDYKVEDGYAVITRKWQKDDVIEYSLPMEVRTVKANDKVTADKGLVALERGPIVYCVEGVDNKNIDGLSVNSNAQFTNTFKPKLLGGVEVIDVKNSDKSSFVAIPYFAWDNRGADKMMVWLPEE